jgi:prepilin-type N-terminal cleavage/methylation domain-containing protein
MVNKMNEKGFTLIELLVVISIIGVLSTVALTSLNSARLKTRDVERKAELNAISKALEVYYSVNNQYPSEGTCDSSKGTCAACPCTGSDWAYSGVYIANVLRSGGYFTNVPVDPLNNSTYYYTYEPDCNQGGCVGKGCCRYTLNVRLESGGSYTIQSANQP